VVLPTPPFWLATAITRFMETVYCTLGRGPEDVRFRFTLALASAMVNYLLHISPRGEIPHAS
jgi:hypothetical protein